MRGYWLDLGGKWGVLEADLGKWGVTECILGERGITGVDLGGIKRLLGMFR